MDNDADLENHLRQRTRAATAAVPSEASPRLFGLGLVVVTPTVHDRRLDRFHHQL
jgi:hypothetical protein